MDLYEYQADSGATAVYQESIFEMYRRHRSSDLLALLNLTYVSLGLAEEAGEVAGNVKKMIRDDGGSLTDERKQKLEMELGDCLWYIAQVATQLEIPLNAVALSNLEKLASRQKRGQIHGDGDSR